MRHGDYIDASAPVNWASPLNRGLVSWWTALPQQSRGVIMRDLCRRNDATLVNGTDPTGPRGRRGGFGSWLYDGTDDYGLSSALNGDASVGFAWMAWIRPGFGSTSDTRRGVFMWTNSSIGGAADPPRIMLIWVNATLGFYFDQKTNFAYSAKPTFAADEWHHLAVSKGPGQTDHGVIYWDGLPLSVTTIAAAGGVTSTSGYDYFHGVEVPGGQYWHGQMNDERLFIVPGGLSASAIYQNYAASLRGWPGELNWYRPRVSAAQGATAFPWHYYQQMQAMAG